MSARGALLAAYVVGGLLWVPATTATPERPPQAVTPPHVPTPTLTPTSSVKDLLRHTVMVFNNLGHGSGVIVGPGQILTARHVIEDAGDQPLQIRFSDGKIVPLKVAWRADNVDVAMLSADTTGYLPARLNCTPVHAGDSVIAAGAPLELVNALAWGHVASDDPPQVPDPNAKNLRAVDITLLPGNSGGPIFNTAGEVVGIAESVMAYPAEVTSPAGQLAVAAITLTGLGFMTPSEVLCKFNLALHT